MTVAIVAEISGNHGGSKARALELVRAAAGAGATHVKFQAYHPLSMVCDPAYVVPAGPWAGRNLHELYQTNATPYEWFEDLFAAATAHDVVPFASVFDLEGLDMLEGLGCPMYKIASFELGHYDLIEAVAARGKPVVLSTGLATEQRLAGAIRAARTGRWDVPLTILKCTSAYPALATDANLLAMRALGRARDWVEVGISDHTTSNLVPALAVALGATMIEKHLRLPFGALFKNEENEAFRFDDYDFSLAPEMFAVMVRKVREAEAILGDGQLRPSEAELENEALLRRLWVMRPIAAGEQLTRENIGVYRGGDGPLAEDLEDFLGRSALVDMAPGPLDLGP